MDLQNHEKFIKDSMKSYQVNLDGDDLWKDLEAHIPEKEKRRFPFFILFSGALLGLFISLIVLGYFDFFNKKNNVDSEKRLLTPTTIAQSDTSPNANYNLVQEENLDAQNASDEMFSEQTAHAQKRSNADMSTVSPQAQLSHNFPMNRTHALESNTSNSNLESESNHTSSPSIVDSKLMNDDVIFDPNSRTEASMSSQNNSKLALVLEQDQTLGSDYERRVQWLTGMLSVPNYGLLDNEIPMLINYPKVVHCPLERVSRWNAYWRVGSTFSTHRLQGASDNLYRQVYNATHKPKLSWNTEFGLNYYVNSNWGLNLGVVVNQLTNQINYRYEDIKKEVKKNEKVLLITSKGNVVESGEQVFVVTKKTYNGKWYHHRLEAGLKTGAFYEYKLLHAYSLVGELGIYTNVYSNQKGHYLTDELTIMQESDANRHRLHLNLNPYVSVSVLRNWKSGFEAGLSMNYQTLKSKYNNKNIRDHIYNIGLVCRYPIN